MELERNYYKHPKTTFILKDGDKEANNITNFANNEKKVIINLSEYGEDIRNLLLRAGQDDCPGHSQEEPLTITHFADTPEKLIRILQVQYHPSFNFARETIIIRHKPTTKEINPSEREINEALCFFPHYK